MAAHGGSPTGIAAAREGVAALKAYAWVIVALAVAGLVAGYLIGASSDSHRYRAWVTAEALGGNDSVTSIGISTPDGPQAADFLSDGILARVEGATGYSYDYLLEHLELTQPPDGGPNPPIALIAVADSEADARSLLRVWLAAVHETRLRYVGRVLNRGEQGLRKSLRRAVNRGETATQKEIVDLLARMQALRTTLSVDYSIQRHPRQFVEGAVSRPRAALIGAVGGLIAGLALALFLSLLGGRLRTAEGVEAALGVELLADLRSAEAIPSSQHARERLRSLEDGRLPATLVVVPCGSLSRDAVAKLSGAFGDGIEVRVAELGEPALLSELSRAGAWAIAAAPGKVRRAEVAALRAELAGIGGAPAGLIVV